MPKIAAALTSAHPVSTRLFSGGSSTGFVCGPTAYHGYAGLDDEVVSYLAGTILNSTRTYMRAGWWAGSPPPSRWPLTKGA